MICAICKDTNIAKTESIKNIEDVLDEINKKTSGKKILLMIDDFGSIYKNEEIDPIFFPDFLNSLHSMKNRERFSLLTVSGEFPTKDRSNAYVYIHMDKFLGKNPLSYWNEAQKRKSNKP